MKKANVVYQKGYDLTIGIVKAFQYLTKEKRKFVLSKQHLRSGTSIGANISKVNGAISKADSSNKISIAHKECLETKYGISLLHDTDSINKNTYEGILAETENWKISFSILKTV
ncbi:MAG: four helix bundle protein [Calditrichia bacterium]